MPIAEQVFLGIVGVSQEGNMALVEYRWKWKPIGIGTDFTLSNFRSVRSVSDAEEGALVKAGVYSYPLKRSRTDEEDKLIRWLANPSEDSLRRHDALIDEKEASTSKIRFRRYDTGWREE